MQPRALIPATVVQVHSLLLERLHSAACPQGLIWLTAVSTTPNTTHRHKTRPRPSHLTQRPLAPRRREERPIHHDRDSIRRNNLCFLIIMLRRGTYGPRITVRTLVHQAGLSLPSLGRAVLVAFALEKLLRVNMASPSLQFQCLLVGPLTPVSMSSTIVFILDVLEECGTPSTR